MFKPGYKYRIKSYEELSKEKNIKIDENGTIFKIKEKEALGGFGKEADNFKNTLLYTKCVDETNYFLLKQISTNGERDFYFETWMCECLGEIIEPIRKFEVGKTYTVLKWNELLRVKDVVLLKNQNGVDKLLNEVVDGNYIFKTKTVDMFDEIFGKEIIIDKEDFINPARNTIIFGGWEVSPWMCKEVIKEEKEKPKSEKQYYTLSEVIEQLSNNFNLSFIHSVSKTELTKNIAGIEIINSKEVLFTEGWEKKQEPVSFREAVEKGAKFRVEHELIEQTYSKFPPQIGDAITEDYIKKFLKGEYLSLNGIMVALAYRLTSDQLAKIMQEGKWFYE